VPGVDTAVRAAKVTEPSQARQTATLISSVPNLADPHYTYMYSHGDHRVPYGARAEHQQAGPGLRSDNVRKGRRGWDRGGGAGWLDPGDRRALARTPSQLLRGAARLEHSTSFPRSSGSTPIRVYGERCVSRGGCGGALECEANERARKPDGVVCIV
jgi:hypothetical protein